MKQHVVIRRYYSKRAKMWVTKEYSYKYGKSTRGKILVNAKGQINKKNYQAYRDAIDRNDKLTDAEKKTLKNTLEDYVEERARNRQKLSTTGFEGHIEYGAARKIEGYFTNFGTSAEIEAEINNLDVEDVLNPNNWINGQLQIGSMIFELEHNYRTGILKRIQ